MNVLLRKTRWFAGLAISQQLVSSLTSRPSHTSGDVVNLGVRESQRKSRKYPECSNTPAHVVGQHLLLWYWFSVKSHRLADCKHQAAFASGFFPQTLLPCVRLCVFTSLLSLKCISHYFSLTSRSSIKQSLSSDIYPIPAASAAPQHFKRCAAASCPNLICQTWLRLNKIPPSGRPASFFFFCLLLFRSQLNGRNPLW